MGAKYLQVVALAIGLTLTPAAASEQPTEVSKGGAFSINQGISGAWFNPATSGQGVLFDIDPANTFLFGAIFTYEVSDARKLGAPEHRWLTLQGNYQGNQAQIPIFVTSGGIFDQPVATSTVPIGNATVTFDSCTSGTIAYALTDPPLTGTIPIVRVIPGTEVLCQQLLSTAGPIPDQIRNDQTTAFVYVTVIPMSDAANLSLTLDRQIVVVENGIISQMGRFGEVVIPEDAVQIDGRGLFLGPGLTEMHTHITVGGRTPAHDAGLLLIANGVTTVLNTGDNFSIGVPELGDRFEAGLKIGPSLLAGSVVYGVGAGALVVNTPAEATAYANRIANAGYEYIKVYWQLTPQVLTQFETESQRLGLPIIGHIPLTRPMSQSLSRGQTMAAHAQEPLFSFMNRQENPDLIAPAAQIFLDNRTYLTPTLAVFEQLKRVYGGNQAGYDQLVQREGNQYTAQTIKDAWLGYFQGNLLQGSGQVPGGLDATIEFLDRITLEFFQAGVPLLVGTDSPGFPGVMSGFGVHVELSLMADIGIPIEAVYAAATLNAGQFVDETLQPAVSFGSVEVGKRADLILMDANPLTTLQTLKRPLAVMARGRLWSQSHLQTLLDALEARISTAADNPKRVHDPDLETHNHDQWMELLTAHATVGKSRH